MLNPPIPRRTFLAGSLAIPALAAIARAGAADDKPSGDALTAAVIGHTGRGEYGHGMDLIFNDVPGVRVVAVADPVEAGRAKAAARCRAERQYADYREMLANERPNLVCVAPRWSEHHAEMALAAIAAGAHVFMEKPFTVTCAEADAVLAAAAGGRSPEPDKAAVRICVAHQMRLAPSVVHLKKRIDEGLIGDLQQIRAFGKQDARAGGEDLLVLGVHLFDLMRLFAGDPLWCTARVLHEGRDITPADARAVKEQIGPVAGDNIFAQFAFANGVTAAYTSRAGMRDQSGHWGVELIGSKGSARILADIWPSVRVMTPGKWTPEGRTDEWRVLPDDPDANAPPERRSTILANRRLVDDWLAAIREKREPTCSGRNAAWGLEMVMAVWHAGLTGARIALPLQDRAHPLRVRSR